MRRPFLILATTLVLTTAALASSEWEKPGEIGVLAGVGLGDDKPRRVRQTRPSIHCSACGSVGISRR
jgi:hypothetical protein